MKMDRIGVFCVFVLAAALALGTAGSQVWAQDLDGQIGEEAKLNGIVVERSGDLFLLRGLDGRETRIRFNSRTEFEERKKNFLRQPLPFSESDVVPGLRVEVKGYWSPAGDVVAEEVKFTQDDLKVARSLDSRLVPVERRLGSVESSHGLLRGQVEEVGSLARENRDGVRELRGVAEQALDEAESAHRRIDDTDANVRLLDRRVSDLVEYDVKENLTVRFDAGSAVLSEEARQLLAQFAERVLDERGYLVEVTGFASADGDEQFNRRLSEKRAAAVVQYLAELHGVPLRNFITPHGFGEKRPVADNATRDGRKQNRRVEVKLLLNRGVDRSSDASRRARMTGLEEVLTGSPAALKKERGQ